VLLFCEDFIMRTASRLNGLGFSILAAVLAGTLLSGCASHQRGEECEGNVCEGPDVLEVSGKADAATKAALFDRVAKLQGEWIQDMTPAEIAEHGQPQTSVITLTSNGSVVRDIMFVGSPHEMTNIYHMDGDELVFVHYCAAGNQPKCEASMDDQRASNQIYFELDEVSNLGSADEHYMGDLTLTFIDDNHYVQEWSNHAAGKVSPMVIKWKRK
jgi:hypothetical protein